MPWQVQCPVRVCAALAAGSGGSDRYLLLCLSCLPLPAPRVLRCVWRAVPSGCPLPSLAGTPFHAVCAFRQLGTVALLVVPACPLGVCALALPRRPLPPRPLGGVACAPRAVPALGASRAVSRGPCPSACPAPVPCSVACLGGGRSGTGSPLPGLRLCAPRGASPWRSCAGGRVLGGGGGAAHAPCPPFVRLGGPVGRGVALPRSVPLPSLGRQQSGCHWRCSGHGGRGPHTTQVCARRPSLGAICAASWRVGAGSLVPRGSCGSQRLGRGGGPCSGSFLEQGEGEPSPLPRGLGAGAPAACGPVGGVGGGRAAASLPPLWGAARSSLAWPPSCCWRTPPRRARSVGVGGPPRGGGAERDGPWTASPGAPFRPEPPPALPEWARVMGGSWGLRPPYCSGAPPCAALRLGPLHWCGLARRPRPPREQVAGGAGARGVQVQPHPPPPRVAVPSWRGGASPPLRGGRGSLLWPSSGGGGAGGGGWWRGRSAAPCPPAPSGVGLPSVVCGAPPRGILVPWGLPGGRGRRARPGRPPMGQCGGGGRVGGGTTPPWFAPLPSPGWPLKGPLRLRCPGRRRSAVGRQWAG